MGAPITIAVNADTARAVSALGNVESRLGGMGSKIARFGKMAAAGLAVAGGAALAFAAKTVQAASDAQQSLGATETVFGKYADRVIKDSDRAAQQFGLSADEYRNNANLIGSLFKNQGVSLDQLAGKTKSMIGTASDLAATFGGPTSDAVEALGSAFKGEFDPLERYGISIKQSTINAELAARGQDKLTGAALRAAQQQATTSLIMRQSADSLGAFGRESDTLAHQQQVLGAQWDNLKAKIGTALLPVLTQAATLINEKVFPALEKMGPPLKAAAAVVGDTLAPAFRVAASYFQAWSANATGIGQSLATNVLPPLRQAGTFLAGTFGPVLRDVGKFITANIIPGFRALGRFMAGTVIPVLAQTATKIGHNLAPAVRQAAATIRKDVIPAAQKVATKFREWWPTISKVAAALLKAGMQGVVLGSKIAGKVLPPVIRFAGFMIRNVVPAIATNIRIIGKIIGVFAAFARAVGNGVNAIGKFAGAVRAKVGEALGVIKRIPGQVKGALSGAAGWLISAGKDLMRGFMDGIGSMASSLADKARSVAQGAVDSVKGFLGIHSPSRVFRELGIYTMQGFNIGLSRGSEDTKKTLDKVTARIKKILDKRYDGKQLARHTRKVAAALKSEYDLVRRNGRAYDKVTAAIEKARDRLASIRKTAADYARSIKDSVVSFGSITSLEEGHLNDPGALVAQMKDRVTQARDYANMLKRLKAQGLNKTTLQQLIDAGVEGGQAQAEALLAGGNSTIKQINKLTAQLAQTGKSLGNQMAQHYYGAGIQAAQGLVKGLQAQQAAVTRWARKLAQALAKAVRSELGIHSPSRVFRDLGRQTALGLQIGLEDVHVKRAAVRLADDLKAGFGRPELTADAVAAAVPGAAGFPEVITIRLTAEQLSALQRGQQAAADLKVYKAAGGALSW